METLQWLKLLFPAVLIGGVFALLRLSEGPLSECIPGNGRRIYTEVLIIIAVSYVLFVLWPGK